MMRKHLRFSSWCLLLTFLLSLSGVGRSQSPEGENIIESPSAGTAGAEASVLTDNRPVLLIDLLDLDKPDLLAGPIWSYPRPYTTILEAYRPVYIIGGCETLVEWVGPKTAVLLWGDSTPKEANSKNIFGLLTFGKQWKTAYEPLFTLDTNKDGAIFGEELKVLWAWLDLNSDALIQEGEVESLGDRVKSISTSVDSDGDGNLWQNQGVEFHSGKVGKSWAWQTLLVNPTIAVSSDSQFGEFNASIVLTQEVNPKKASIYSWRTLGADNTVNGVLRFIQTRYGLYVISSSTAPWLYTGFRGLKAVVPHAKFMALYAKVDRAGNSLSWEFETRRTRDSSIVNVVNEGKELNADGTFFSEDVRVVSGPYRWVGNFSSPEDKNLELLQSLSAIDPEEFSRGLEQSDNKKLGSLLLPPIKKYQSGVKLPEMISPAQEAEGAR